ncbi:uncharacterized protein N7483_012525 [Penicillium malachiteum]|uniref:uncharacterized protein n=1 Tax=Penicillium malachiteum TaxID=1324776 RepID=UPI0025490954|nr:uncharacterized protein N7483_012525 [Penicillium malachiteum]KAJ5715344.1 hypothetical protein N7483_012525 [Penicillium malachiteum]
MKELDGTPKPNNPEDGNEIMNADGCEGITDASDTVAATTTHPFGVWLPDSLTIQDADCLTKSGSGPCLTRFHEIETIFFETEKLEPDLLAGGLVALSDVKEMDDEINVNEGSLESDDEMIPMWLVQESSE